MRRGTRGAIIAVGAVTVFMVGAVAMAIISWRTH